MEQKLEATKKYNYEIDRIATGFFYLLRDREPTNASQMLLLLKCTILLIGI